MPSIKEKLEKSKGLAQCLAMVPGISRSGASIMGALALGVERKAAAEFSFFLAVPTMLAAAGYDLYRAKAMLTPDTMTIIATGFVVSFIVAIVVIRWMLAFVSKHGFAPFAWYRIVLGGAMLLWIF
jgi:undecaprenyl-diphosphatase